MKDSEVEEDNIFEKNQNEIFSAKTKPQESKPSKTSSSDYSEISEKGPEEDLLEEVNEENIQEKDKNIATQNENNLMGSKTEQKESSFLSQNTEINQFQSRNCESKIHIVQHEKTTTILGNIEDTIEEKEIKCFLQNTV